MEASPVFEEQGLEFRTFSGSYEETGVIQNLIAADLTEPYSIFTYRYFLSQWPELCLLCYKRAVYHREGRDEKIASTDSRMVACVVSKIEEKTDRSPSRGYIAMLTVGAGHRNAGIGTELVRQTVERMREQGCEWAYLETPVENYGAIKLYENLGFIKEKRLTRYYMNGEDAFRLKVLLQ
mmetsp:Transcript_24372/g.37950  ORF Transcript_24372/g.37950 Transcript_24372/m.37950 type:complete len:180 (-) Transcript_24372:45-584(-)